MICSKCGREVRDGCAVCEFCGTPVDQGERLTCLVCGESIDPWDKFCPKCGMPAVASQTDMTARRHPIQSADVSPDANTSHAKVDSSSRITFGASEQDKSASSREKGRQKEQISKKPPKTPIVPMDASASSEETIMVLDPPDVPLAGKGDYAKVSEDNAKRHTHRHSSKKLSSDRRKRNPPPSTRSSVRLPLVLGGSVFLVVVIGIAVFEWLNRHKESSDHSLSVPVAEISAVPPVIESQPAVQAELPIKTSQSVPSEDSSSPADDIDTSEPAATVSELPSEPPPALIVAPSEKSAPDTADKPVVSPQTQSKAKLESKRHSRKPASKKNAEEEYLRQIHRQLQRQRE